MARAKSGEESGVVAGGSPWPKRKRQPDPAFNEKREAVLTTAARLFVEKGYENTSLNELASVLNVTKPTLYYYFESKEQILLEIVERSHQQHLEVMQQVLNSKRTGREKLKLACERYATLMTEDIGKCQVKINRKALAPELRENLRAKLVYTDSIVRQILAEGIRDGTIAKCDVKLATFMIFGALNWFAFWHREDGEYEAGKIAESMVELLLRGLEPR